MRQSALQLICMKTPETEQGQGEGRYITDNTELLVNSTGEHYLSITTHQLVCHSVVSDRCQQVTGVNIPLTSSIDFALYHLKESSMRI